MHCSERCKQKKGFHATYTMWLASLKASLGAVNGCWPRRLGCSIRFFRLPPLLAFLVKCFVPQRARFSPGPKTFTGVSSQPCFPPEVAGPLTANQQAECLGSHEQPGVLPSCSAHECELLLGPLGVKRAALLCPDSGALSLVCRSRYSQACGATRRKPQWAVSCGRE